MTLLEGYLFVQPGKLIDWLPTLTCIYREEACLYFIAVGKPVLQAERLGKRILSNQ